MHTNYFLLAGWMASALGTPIQLGKYRKTRADTAAATSDGKQTQTPCPDLIDPQTENVALYYSVATTKEQRRSTQFVNDQWGLPGCCNQFLRHSACPPPPDPLPDGSPCPDLKDEDGIALLYYQNPYTTSQIASNIVIGQAVVNHDCLPYQEKSPAYSLPPVSSNTGVAPFLSAGNADLPYANGVNSKSRAVDAS